jgi:DUF1680 family protein
MLLATGEPRYADAAERMLLNGFLAGVSLRGSEYFYVNPLQLRTGAHADGDRSPAHGRRGWFDCACCPTNIMRMLASLGGYVATTDADGLQLHLYAQGNVTAAVAGGEVDLSVETDYPWDGLVRVRVERAPEADWTLSLRVPGWAGGATLHVSGQDGAERPVAAGSYTSVRRSWRPGDVVELVLPMAVRTVRADERVDAVRGCLAIERGPIVYAVEQADQADGVVVDDLRLDPAGPMDAEHRPDVLGGVTVVSARGRVGAPPVAGWPYRDGGPAPAGPEVRLTAVPYFAWANRAIGPMRVWLPRA